MKRISFALLILFLFTSIYIEAKKQPLGNGLFWELDNGVLTISGFGDMPDFMWKSSKGYQSPWLKELKKGMVKKVIIDEGVTSISNWAFSPYDTYSSITEVSFPSTLKRIGDHAFYKARIKNLSLNDGVEVIGELAFGENQIEELVIPNSVKELGGGYCYISFYGTTYFWEKFSGKGAFGDRVRKAKLSSNLKKIPKGLFYGCVGLQEINIPKGVVEIEKGAFYECGIQNLIIPIGCRKIGDMSFGNCKKLRSIFLPNSIEFIHGGAFLIRGAKKRYKSDNLDFDYIEDIYWDGIIYNLPDTITDRNCRILGISDNAVKRYLKGENGIVNSKGNIILQAKQGRTVEKVNLGDKNLLFYKVSEGAYFGLMNDNGNWIVPIEKKCSEIRTLGDNYLRIKCNGFFGIVTLEGLEVIPTSRNYTSISSFNKSKKTFAFTRKGVSGICNEQGKEISTTRLAPTAEDIKANGGFTSAVAMDNGSKKYYKVSKGGRYGLTDSEGRLVIPCEMEGLESAGTGFLKYKLNGFWGLMNYQGKILIDTDRGYTSIGDYKTFNKRFAYTMNGYKGECDATGRQISKIKVDTPKRNSSIASSSGSSSSSNSSSSGSSSNSNSGNNTTTIHVEHHHDPVPVQQWQACFACGGMGTMGCDNCGGSGTKYIGDRLHRCSRCNGRGIIPCNVCYGNKGQYVTVYK